MEEERNGYRNMEENLSERDHLDEIGTDGSLLI